MSDLEREFEWKEKEVTYLKRVLENVQTRSKVETKRLAAGLDKEKETEFKKKTKPPPPPPRTNSYSSIESSTTAENSEDDSPLVKNTIKLRRDVATNEISSQSSAEPVDLPPPPPPPPAPPMPPSRHLADVDVDAAPPPPPPPPPPMPVKVQHTINAPPLRPVPLPPPTSGGSQPLVSGHSPPPPGPPPPPSAFRMNGKVVATKPSGPKLKPFFWKKIDAPNQKSIWKELSSTPLVTDDDFGELVDVFRMDLKENKPDVKPSKEQVPVKRSIFASRAATSLLDITRANNIGAHFIIVCVQYFNILTFTSNHAKAH